MDPAHQDHRSTDAARRDPVDVALVALSPVVIVLSMALHEYVQAAAVLVLLVVAVTKLRAPHAEWLHWTPQIATRR